ncbi:MAG: ATP-dependent DNA helicase UvrD2 [Dermatophilaceae bacterium]
MSPPPSQPSGAPTADDILDALDPEQRQVAASPSGPMCVLAGAGTGKTRAITHRIAYGVHSGAYQAQRVLAVTFTARAAGEMRSRLRALGVPGVQARTFHAAALRQLHYFWPQAIGGAAPEVLPHKASVVAEAGSRLRLQLDRVAVRDLAAEVEWAKVSMLTPETYAVAARRAGRAPADLDPTAMARVLQTYEEVKAERGVIDFEDVLLLTVGILAEREDIARVVRSQYRHFVVDEYQDVNALQQRLLDLWVGSRDDVCVVGDAAQTIYSFTGATPKYLLDFSHRYPKSQVVQLVRNYRSTPQIVALANLMVRSGGGQFARKADLLQLRAQGQDGPPPVLTAYSDDPSEAAGVATAIKKLLASGTQASQIAVLFRTNAQSEAFESALGGADIAYLVRGGERFFARKEVRGAILLMRGAARADDGAKPLGELVRDVIAGAGWTEKAPAAGGATRDRWESLQALVGLADDFASGNPAARLPDMVAELDERLSAQHAPTVEGVTLASLHAAKGLEWDCVFVVGCSDGLIPISMADGFEAIEEERRLLYVGLTRARRELRMSWSASRNPGGRASRRPSRFLDGAASILGDGAKSSARAGRSGAARTGKPGKSAKPLLCRGCGKDLATAATRKVGRCEDCPPTYDVATFEALKVWRLAVASVTKVPAYVIFTDATLTAIAEKTPASAGELATISGVGARKLERYAADVLAILAGADPSETAEKSLAAGELAKDGLPLSP